MNAKLRGLAIILTLVVGTYLLALGGANDDTIMWVSGIALNVVGGYNVGALTAQAEGS